MKRIGNLYKILISDENLAKAIKDVNASHHYVVHGNKRKINKVTLWVEKTKKDRIVELRNIINSGFTQSPMRKFRIYDENAQKYRDICEPKQYPDQYIHHAVQQCLEPVMMRGIDDFCCGSIKGRGAALGIRAIKKWMKTDVHGTKYALECDIHHFYDSIKPEVAFEWFTRHIKDHRVLGLVWEIIGNGVTIGGFFSQWVANSMLQPIDNKIRESGLCNHYVRYIDNFTILGSNKRKLKKLLLLLEQWLAELGLSLKSNKQIFAVKNRMVSALGYRFDHQKTFVRKRNLLRIRRKVRSIKQKLSSGKMISYKEAAGVLSKIGQFKHCDSFYIFRMLCQKGFVKTLKSIIRIYSRKRGANNWNILLLNAKTERPCFV